MRIRVAIVLAVLGLGQALPEPAAGSAPSSAAALTVTNEAGQTTRFTPEALRALPHTKVQVKDHAGQSAEYEGVALADVLQRAGVTLGKSLRGPRLASYLLVEAADGYRVVFALPELDPAASEGVVLLADGKEGQPLPAKEGPLRIVVPREKQHSRWVRQVVGLRVLSAPPSEKAAGSTRQ
jgi:DMSO/TMAO reductase YedYZ molybdopterin-dependent catalytic subunit